MRKILTLFLTVVGLVLVAINPAFAHGNNQPLPSGIVTSAFNDHTGPTALFTGPAGRSYLVLAANSEGRGTTTATLNTSLAILAGVLTLMLLQRRSHAHFVLRPRH